MTPMIDVIFLLLTFFVYSMAMMIHASVLPVQLTPLAAGKPAEQGALDAITVDKDGKLFFNREATTFDTLAAKLAEFKARADHGPLYVAMEATGETDRGPVLINLIERLRQAGVNDFVIVGQPQGGSKTVPTPGN